MPAIIKDLGYFSADHSLPNHDGLCKNLHGHNYRVEIAVWGDVEQNGNVPTAGMVMDFSEIKRLYLRNICDKLDHATLLGTNLPPWYRRFVASIAPQDSEEEDMKAGEVVDRLLGKVAHLPIPDTTAEWLSLWMHDVMAQALRSSGHLKVKVLWVRVWETETSCAQSGV